MRVPSAMPSQKVKSPGARMMMVEPCSNQPSSSPLVTLTSQGKLTGPRVCAFSTMSRKCRRMLATRIAATGTSVTASPVDRCVRITARSFLQNRRSTRFSAIGLTFQTSPWISVTRSICAS